MNDRPEFHSACHVVWCSQLFYAFTTVYVALPQSFALQQSMVLRWYFFVNVASLCNANSANYSSGLSGGIGSVRPCCILLSSSCKRDHNGGYWLLVAASLEHTLTDIHINTIVLFKAIS